MKKLLIIAIVILATDIVGKIREPQKGTPEYYSRYYVRDMFDVYLTYMTDESNFHGLFKANCHHQFVTSQAFEKENVEYFNDAKESYNKLAALRKQIPASAISKFGKDDRDAIACADSVLRQKRIF